jgi:hypothetical protein
MYELIVISLFAAYWGGGHHLHKECPEKQTCPHQHGATASWLMARNRIHQTVKAAATPRKRSTDKRHKEHNRKGVVFQLQHTRSVFHSGSAKQRGTTAAASSILGSCGRFSRSGKLSGLAPVQQTNAYQSVPAPSVKSLPVDNMFRVASVVQLIVTEFSGAVSEEVNIVAITKIVVNLTKQNHQSL